jgi:hypothetical protein
MCEVRRRSREPMSPETPDRDRPFDRTSEPWSAGSVEIPRTRGWWTQRRPGPPLVDFPGRGADPGEGDRARATGAGAGGNGSARLPPTGSDEPAGGAAGPVPTRSATADDGRGTMAIWIAAIGVVVLVMSVHFFPSARLSRVIVPIVGLCAAIGFGARLQRKHPEEPWLLRWLVYAMIVKEIASILRYRTLVNSYGDVGDATVYDKYGRRFVNIWLHTPGAVAPHLDNLRKSNFLRWFTGIIYFLFGEDMIAGFIAFALIAFVGSYLWYRAAVVALPFLNRRLFFLFVFFAPSIAFWPSSIGKEALMQFGIGSAALGTAHLLRGRIVRGIAVAAPGAWLLWVVRPHLLALVTLGAAGAFLIGKSPRRAKSDPVQSSLVKPVGMIVVGFLALFAVSQGANSLGLPSLTLGSVQAELDATTVSTGQGNSSFNNGGNSLSPLHLPQGAVTVLLRPFPWEVSSPLQILASLEGLALAGFIVYRRRSLAISLRRLRSSPFLFYCWAVTLLYAITFQAFANFGLLVRERSLVLPALYVLLCLEPGPGDEEQSEARATASAVRAGRGIA